LSEKAEVTGEQSTIWFHRFGGDASRDRARGAPRNVAVLRGWRGALLALHRTEEIGRPDSQKSLNEVRKRKIPRARGLPVRGGSVQTEKPSKSLGADLGADRKRK